MLIAVPLAAQTFGVIEERNFQRSVNDAVQEWDPTASSIEVTTSLDNGRGSVEVDYLLRTDDTATAD